MIDVLVKTDLICTVTLNAGIWEISQTRAATQKLTWFLK